MDGSDNRLAQMGVVWRDIGNGVFDQQAVSLLEQMLREAAERLESEMKDVIHEHVVATNKVKGEIVPKTDSNGRPVLLESGKPKQTRLVIRYEIRFARMQASKTGITFPNLYWGKRKGAAVKATRGPGAGRSFVPLDTIPLKDGQISHSIGVFKAANVIERQIIEKTEAKAAALRFRSRFYSGLWANVRAFRSSKHFNTYLQQLQEVR